MAEREPDNNGNNRDGQKKNGFFAGVRRKADAYREQIREREERYFETNDPIYREPIHKPDGDVRERVLTRGGIDVWFLLIVTALILYGAVMAYSASSIYAAEHHGNSMFYFSRHLLYIVAALFITVPFVLRAKLWTWRVFAVAIYALTVVLLLLVLVTGTIFGGAKRWLDLKIFTIQPSEIAKMAVVLILALIYAKYDGKLSDTQKFGGRFRYGILIPGCALGLICVLVALEKHLSGTIIIGSLGLIMMVIGGASGKWMGAITGVGVAGASFILMVSDYAQKRVHTWLHIEEADPLGAAWQTLQGLYAIGSGGVFGLGLGNSRQKFGYVSQPPNDFIFAIVCEELGFVGAALVIGLVLALLLRGYRIASRAPDKFSSLVVYGLVTKVALQTVLNIAVVTNSMPNTGISLPFFSSGGTSLAMQIFEMGIVLSISRYSYQER